MCRYLRRQPPLRIWALLTVLFLTLKEWEVIPHVQWRKNLQFPCSYRVSADLKAVPCLLHNQWHLSQTKFRTLNSLLTDSQLVSQPWKRMQRPSPVELARQDLGIYSDIVMAPQPLHLLGPMVQGHLMTIEIQDEGLIRSQALKTTKREVPYYFESLVSNTTKELRYGSMSFGKNPICPYTKNLSEFIAKQVLCRPDLYLKHEPSVKTLLLDIKMMVSPMQLTVPSAAPIPLSLSANPNHPKTERLENNLRCGENWLTNLKFSSLKEMTKVHSSSQHLTLVHKSSALNIEETRLENLCSNLPPLKMDKHFHLLHLICLFLMFLLKCSNGFSLKPTRPMCDGRLFASFSPSRLGSRGAFFCGFPFRWVLHLVLSLSRCVIVYGAASCPREGSLSECECTGETLSCLFFAALWLPSIQSVVVLEAQSTKDIDLTCFKTFPIKTTTCLQVGPMSLDWPLDPLARFDLSCSSLSPGVPSDEQQRVRVRVRVTERVRGQGSGVREAVEFCQGGSGCSSGTKNRKRDKISKRPSGQKKTQRRYKNTVIGTK